MARDEFSQELATVLLSFGGFSIAATSTAINEMLPLYLNNVAGVSAAEWGKFYSARSLGTAFSMVLVPGIIQEFGERATVVVFFFALGCCLPFTILLPIDNLWLTLPITAGLLSIVLVVLNLLCQKLRSSPDDVAAINIIYRLWHTIAAISIPLVCTQMRNYAGDKVWFVVFVCIAMLNTACSQLFRVALPSVPITVAPASPKAASSSTASASIMSRMLQTFRQQREMLTHPTIGLALFVQLVHGQHLALVQQHKSFYLIGDLKLPATAGP